MKIQKAMTVSIKHKVRRILDILLGTCFFGYLLFQNTALMKEVSVPIEQLMMLWLFASYLKNRDRLGADSKDISLRIQRVFAAFYAFSLAYQVLWQLFKSLYFS